MVTFAKVFFVLAVFMMGERFEAPFPALLALPFVPLMKPLTASRKSYKVFLFLLAPCAVVSAAFSIARFSKMTAETVLPKTPVIGISLAVLATAAYLAAGRPVELGRWGKLSFLFCAGLIALSAMLLAGKLQLNEIAVPHFWEGNAVVFACDTVTLLGIMPLLKYKDKPLRTYFFALGSVCVLWAAVYLLCGFTVGNEGAYPFFNALRVAKGGEIIGRFEALITPAAFFITVSKSAVCLYPVKEMIDKKEKG